MSVVRETILGTDDPADVAQMATEAVAAYPNDAAVIEKVCMALADPVVGEHDKAVHLLRDALQRLPGDARLRMALSDCYVLGGNYEASNQVLRELIETDSSNPEPYYRLATAIRIGVEPAATKADAERYFRAAIELDSSKWYYHHGLGVSYWQDGQLESARRELATALRLIPESEREFAVQAKRWLREIDAGRSFDDVTRVSG